MTQRIIAIGLDGFEPSIAKALIAQGDLTFLRALLDESATFQLDHGEARYTGLAWEHFSTGYAPSGYHRWSAVDFEPSTYSIAQKATRHEPFTAKLQKRVLAFDIPYHELAASNVCGLASWGAHDPGVHQHSRPHGLTQEIESRFGCYPAKQFIYGYVWPDAARTEQMGHCLDEALKLRNRIAQWLMSERLPDWDLAIIVVSEFHSALEALWHGWDPAHPLHNVPSAAPAREGIVRLYRTLDVMLKELRNRYPDAVLCLFSPHGMGPNTSDLPAMALVPELMFRDAFRKPLLRAHPSSAADGDVPPLLHPESWSRSVLPYLATGSPKASGKR
jgi:predicted AlkP superfamily phosphohydrolase/phosphomutase